MAPGKPPPVMQERGGADAKPPAALQRNYIPFPVPFVTLPWVPRGSTGLLAMCGNLRVPAWVL